MSTSAGSEYDELEDEHDQLSEDDTSIAPTAASVRHPSHGADQERRSPSAALSWSTQSSPPPTAARFRSRTPEIQSISSASRPMEPRRSQEIVQAPPNGASGSSTTRTLSRTETQEPSAPPPRVRSPHYRVCSILTASSSHPAGPLFIELLAIEGAREATYLRRPLQR